MKSETTQFMLEEYQQIANAYQDLHAQQNELVKFFLTIVALPSSIFGLLLQINISDLASMPKIIIDNLDNITLLFKILMVALVFVGFSVFFALIVNRSEAILYVKTVNCVRRFFIDNDESIKLEKYLVLSNNDKFPSFWEGISSRSFWNIAIVALINSGIFSLALYVIFFQNGTITNLGWKLFIVSIIWFILQEIAHWCYLSSRDNTYNAKFPIEKQKVIIGIDLDGVLGDLAREVIYYAQQELNKKISYDAITSFDLSKCTNLTNEEINHLFKETKIFRTMKPLYFSSDFCEMLAKKNWCIHIVTDRFWNNHDWEIANNWLKENKIVFNHLALIRSNEKKVYSYENNIQYFIEDNLVTALELASVCKKVFLIDAPYNQGRITDNIYRVSNLYDIKILLSD